jgi:hypothetical protein
MNFYSKKTIQRLLEDEEISPAEAAFMQGYRKAIR